MNPELIRWRYLDSTHSSVLVTWSDGEIHYKTIFDVDHDIDGPSFHYRAGDPIDGSCGIAGDDFDELFMDLRGDMSALEGSHYGPIKPYYYEEKKR